MTRTALTAFAFVCLALIGCITVSVEEPEVCKTDSAAFPGAGNALPPGYIGSTDKDISLNSKDFSLLTRGVFTGGEISILPDGGVANLDFIQTASVALMGKQKLLLLEYKKSGENLTSIPIPGVDANIMDYLNDEGETVIRFTLSGYPPNTDWKIGFRVCFGGGADFEYKL